MKGEAKKIIDLIIKQRAHGDPTLTTLTKTKLLLKGIDTAKYTENSEDDAFIVNKIKGIARELSVTI